MVWKVQGYDDRYPEDYDLAVFDRIGVYGSLKRNNLHDNYMGACEYETWWSLSTAVLLQLLSPLCMVPVHLFSLLLLRVSCKWSCHTQRERVVSRQTNYVCTGREIARCLVITVCSLTAKGRENRRLAFLSGLLLRAASHCNSLRPTDDFSSCFSAGGAVITQAYVSLIAPRSTAMLLLDR